MTEQEFKALPPNPQLVVTWNGKSYRLVRARQSTETCFLQPEGKKMRHPYATGYRYVTIVGSYRRKRPSDKTSFEKK